VTEPRIYDAEEAEALAATLTKYDLSAGWYRIAVPGGDSIAGPDGSTDPTAYVACEGVLVARCELTDVAVLVAAAPDLARSVVHHARRANETETVLSLAETAAREMQIESMREIRRLRQGIAQVEMVTLPNGRLCPFCRAVAWRLGRTEDRVKHRPGCLWAWAKEEVSDGYAYL